MVHLYGRRVKGGSHSFGRVVWTRFPKRLADRINANPVAFATLCGIGVALCGIASDGTVFAAAYEQARQMLHETGTHEGVYRQLSPRFLPKRKS